MIDVPSIADDATCRFLDVLPCSIAEAEHEFGDRKSRAHHLTGEYDMEDYHSLSDGERTGPKWCGAPMWAGENDKGDDRLMNGV